MGKINRCLKSIFLLFNMLFAMVGALMMIPVVMMTIDNQNPIIVWLWILAIGIFSISCLGLFAGFSEKLLALKTFAGFMYLGIIIMLIFGIIWTVLRNKVKESFDIPSHDFIQEYMANKHFTHDRLQNYYQCCGLRSAEDWGETIPDSCECINSSDCKPKPAGYSGPSMIYSKPCGELFFQYYDIVFKLSMGIYFGFSVTALFGLLFTLLMIRQVSHHDSAGGPSMVMTGS